MKKTTAPQEAKIFKITFSKTILALSITILLICLAGIGISVWRIFSFGIHSFNDVLKYPFLILVGGFCIAVVVAILIRSQYILDKEYLTAQFGFVKTKYDVKKITSLLLDTDSKKLTVNCGEEFFVLMLSNNWNEEFVRALLSVNPDIDYSFTLSDNEKSEDK